MPRLFALCLTLSLGLGVWPAAAQFETGSITGTVRDDSGAVLPGVTITLRQVDTGVTQTTHTDESGVFEYFTVRLGRYEVLAGLLQPGDAALARRHCRVQGGDQPLP